MRAYYMKYLSEKPCDACKGKRLRPESLAVKFAGATLDALAEQTVAETHAVLPQRPAERHRRHHHRGAPQRRSSRASASCSTSASSTSRSRARRARSRAARASASASPRSSGASSRACSTCSTSPSIGLHPRDNERLLRTLRRLRDLGNTVVVVEHDEETMRAARLARGLRPRRGRARRTHRRRGHARLESCAIPSRSTGAYLSGRAAIAVPQDAPQGQRRSSSRYAARASTTCKNVDVTHPARRARRASPASRARASPRSSTASCYPALARALHDAHVARGAHDKRARASSALDKVIAIDQQPIGRTPRSQPGDVHEALRPRPRRSSRRRAEARQYGYDPGRFSFNVKGGRCEACGGDGVRKRRDALPRRRLRDVRGVPRPPLQRRDAARDVQGQEHRRRARHERARGASSSSRVHKEIARVAPDARRRRPRLHQARASPAPTLSGGEAQRIKLARELSARRHGPHALRPRRADDGPPLRGHRAPARACSSASSTRATPCSSSSTTSTSSRAPTGSSTSARRAATPAGVIVAQGTPEAVAQAAASHTGRFLARMLTHAAKAPRQRAMERSASSTLKAFS